MQLDLFEESRLPRRPYCSWDKTASRIRSLKQALAYPYIQINPPHLRVWSIHDVDRVGGGIAWEDANLPIPSWAAINSENGHAHLVWGLSAPVLVDSPDLRQAPLRYLNAIESAFRARLDADDGFAGLMTKNPTHPQWSILKGRVEGYELGELAEWVDLSKFKPRIGAKVERIGLGRNITIFDLTRLWAYKNVRDWKKATSKGVWVYWMQEVNRIALERNGDLPTPLHQKEIWHIARSVARWVWNRFDIEASDRRWRERQAHRGRLSGQSRLKASEDKRASARLMHAQGMSQTKIAQEIGVTRRTVYAWIFESGK